MDERQSVEDVPELTEHVQRRLREVGAEVGLRADTAHATYVLNWGGFGRGSFTLDDGRRRLHLKLARDGDQRGLRRWQRVNERLCREYHAPRMIGWLDVPEADRSGPIFEHVDGRWFEPRRWPSVLAEITAKVDDLHHDTELIDFLTPLDPRRNFSDCLHSRYTEMFEEDLRIIAAHRPPFVTADRLAWMSEETQRLAAMACSNNAFRGQATYPCHWDLWCNNILVTPDERWFLLDWDDLSLGDPALDYATLAFPLTHGDNRVDWRDLSLPTCNDVFGHRIDLYLQAQMLDCVVDVLADWVECETTPEHSESVRREKRAQHERYYALYTSTYGP